MKKLKPVELASVLCIVVGTIVFGIALWLRLLLLMAFASWWSGFGYALLLTNENKYRIKDFFAATKNTTIVEEDHKSKRD